MISICEAAARPSEYRDFQFLKSLHNIGPKTINIRDIGILSNVYSFIDTGAEMLGEMTVNLLVYIDILLIRLQYQPVLCQERRT
jgi:hypothetical protein